MVDMMVQLTEFASA